MKKVTNSSGRYGKEDHRSKIQILFDTLINIFSRVRKEGRIIINDQKSRYADLVVYDENGQIIEIHQVGRTNKDGTPVAREKKAMKDIEKATGIKVIFHALPFILLLIGLMIYFGITKQPFR